MYFLHTGQFVNVQASQALYCFESVNAADGFYITGYMYIQNKIFPQKLTKITIRGTNSRTTLHVTPLQHYVDQIVNEAVIMKQRGNAYNLHLSEVRYMQKLKHRHAIVCLAHYTHSCRTAINASLA